MKNNRLSNRLNASLGTWEVMVAGVALVVAASTMVSDFQGFFTLGGAFAIALLLAFLINLFLGMSAADLSVAYPRAGALYDFAKAVFPGSAGRFLGVFLGLAFFGMSAFAASGEVAAGALGLQALLPAGIPLPLCVVALYFLAALPNILGIKTTAWVSAALLILMLGIRWFFGLAGFLDFSQTGAWSAANLDAGVGVLDWFGEQGILAAGLALAFWSFVGIEFACSLAEEVKNPAKALPRGVILGLLLILGTSLVMGLGVTGSAPLAVWSEAANGKFGAGGDAPQMAVGQLMFGQWGYYLMALASLAATLGSLVVFLATVPRILFSIAREGLFFGPLSGPFARLHPRFNTPVLATVFTTLVFVVPALYSSAVIDWVYSAAYVWILLYVVYHLLAFLNRRFNPTARRAFAGKWFQGMTLLGAGAALAGLYYAFAGAHGHYGLRALIVLGGALLATGISFRLSGAVQERPAHLEMEKLTEAELVEDLGNMPRPGTCLHSNKKAIMIIKNQSRKEKNHVFSTSN